ncbi:hypothetical protein PO909_007474 [Leuciscus waleckii]
MASDRDPTSMAAASSRKSFMEFMFKGHYRRQLMLLLRTAIEYVSESDDESDDDDGDNAIGAKRVRNLKKQMSLIRGYPISWDELPTICVNGIEPPCVLVKDALVMMHESSTGVV